MELRAGVSGGMTPKVDVITAFLNLAKAFVGQREVPVNKGQLVQLFQKITGNVPPAPWCSSFVVWCLVAVLGKRSPLPRSGAVQAVANWAQARGILVDYPARGALMVFWNQRDSRGPRFAHIGAVLEVIDAQRKITRNIEGNTSDSKGVDREGVGVFEKERTADPKDRWILWWLALEPDPGS